MNRRSKDKGSKTASSEGTLSTEAKAERLREILERAARRSNEDAERAQQEQLQQDRSEAQTEEEKDLLQKIQRTYEKYL